MSPRVVHAARGFFSIRPLLLWLWPDGLLGTLRRLAIRHYSEIVTDLRRAGNPLPTNDIWIASTAARSGALVLTYDRHFEEMARVGSIVLS